MHKIHIRSLFSILIPTEYDPGASVEFVDTPNHFGFILNNAQANQKYLYQLELVVLNDENTYESWASFGTKRPINFREESGITVYIKINHGMFDFRTFDEQLLAQIKVSVFRNDVFTQTGCTNVFEILPKKRQHNPYSGGCNLKIQWNIDNNNNYNNQYYGYGTIERNDLNNNSFDTSPTSYSSSAALSNSSMELADCSSNQIFTEDYSGHVFPQSEQYMVLYNGNAEVVGNFRALNFYKSSDINIKDDIRLLVEDYGCRETMLKIDGVEYKFKKGVHADTNRRFVGYIAQQVESVVPQAVQLIDGVLHVDYESLIPYLSEAMRENYNDIKEAKESTERLRKVVDSIYAQFTRQNFANNPPTSTSHQDTFAQQEKNRNCNYLWTFILVVVGVSIVVAATLLFAAMTKSQSSNVPMAPLTESTGKPPDNAPDRSAIERDALQDFFIAMHGPNWIRKDNWLTNNSVCNWFGLECENGTFINSITLAGNNLVGTIPYNITLLTRVQLIDLSNNTISGALPPLDHLIDLSTLLLSHNNISGYYGGLILPNFLGTLDLSYNSLEGSFVELMMVRLRSINLEHNRLQGTLPNILSMTLRSLQLGNNAIYGQLPQFSERLEVIGLDQTLVQGSVEQFKSVSSLKVLDISHSSIGGTLALTSHQLKSLAYLNVSFTFVTQVQFNGRELNESTICDATGTLFECPIPDWLIKRCNASCV